MYYIDTEQVQHTHRNLAWNKTEGDWIGKECFFDSLTFALAQNTSNGFPKKKNNNNNNKEEKQSEKKENNRRRA